MWLLFLCIIHALAQDAPRVTIKQGVVVGSNANNGDYYTFYGIHYGGSTAGKNRFKAPTPPPKYYNEHMAVNNEIICAQPSSRGIIGTEDCLVLDIFTKNLTTPKPVFVWIEGEEFETTSKTITSFKNVVREDILVVSIKYRLSIFGFLCLRVSEAPGNAGLKDVIQGLQWIQENIAAFGGDPNNVMLVGHGSGAAMADLITLSPMSKNLVHKVIAISGSALASWAVSYDPVGYAQRFGEALSYTDKTPKELAQLLSSTDISLLNSVLQDFEFYNNTLLFAPCIENTQLNGTFLHDAPINIIQSGNYTDVPYIAGFTNREGTMRAEQVVSMNWLENMEANFMNFLPADLKFENNSVKMNVSNTIKKFYFGELPVSRETIEDFLDYEGDVLVLIPTVKEAKERSLTTKSSVRLFEFAYKGPINSDWIYPQIPLTGARHGSILNYLFDFDVGIGGDEAVKALMNRLLLFARTGSPAQDNITEWLPLQNALMNVHYFSGGEVKLNFTIFGEEAFGNKNSERIDFWEKIYAERYLTPTVSSANSLLGFGLIVIFTEIILVIDF